MIGERSRAEIAIWVWVFLLRFRDRYFKGLGAWKKSGTNGSGDVKNPINKEKKKKEVNLCI